MHFGKRSSWTAILVILILIASAMACQSHSPSEAVPGTDNSEGSDQHGTQSFEAPPRLYPPGDYSRTLSYGGLERIYTLHVPPSKGGPVPLLIVLHGGGGTGIGMQKSLTQGGLDTLADRDGFMVVYPDGVDKGWNDGRADLYTRSALENIDDVGFISVLIDHLVQDWGADPKRVYATGISNGAMMAQRLAFQLSHKVVAIAAVAGNMPKDLLPLGSPPRPISVLLISGTEDRWVPYQGGFVMAFGQTRGAICSAPETADFWAKNNGCSLTALTSEEPDRDIHDGTRVRRQVYGGGQDGTEVLLYTIEGGGHTWPGGLQYLPESMVGRTCRDIDANQVIWEFFQQHTAG